MNGPYSARFFHQPVQFPLRNCAMAEALPVVTSPLEFPVEPGAFIRLDPSTKFHGDLLMSGGSPWRLMRLSGSSSRLANAWREGALVGPGEGGFARTLVVAGFARVEFDPRAPVDVDVVIPVRNDATGLRNLLAQLRDFNVVVVDDGSENAQEISSCVVNDRHRLLQHESPRGPAAARNTGLRATRAPFVCFIDVDVQLASPGEALSVLRGRLEDPMTAATAPRVRGASGPGARNRFESHFGALDLGTQSGVVRAHSRVAYVPSACLMVRREAIGDGFDESLMTGEDVDLVWRLGDAGWLVDYCAEAEVTHPARSSWSSWWRQRVGYGASAAALKRRHPDKLETVRVDAFTLTSWVLVLLKQPRLATAVMRVAFLALARQLPEQIEQPERVAGEIVVGGIVRAGGPLARAVVRSYMPLLVLLCASKRARGPVLVVLAVGSAWRWRRQRFDPRDVVPAVADDAAYATGLIRGAVVQRQLNVLVPSVIRPRAPFGSFIRPRERITN